MYRYLTLLLAVALIPGCNVVLYGPLDFLFGGDDGGGDATGSADLKAFESEEELSQYFADQIGARNEQFAAPGGGWGDFRDEELLIGMEDGDAAPGDVPASETAVDAPSADSGAAQGGGAESVDNQHSETTIQEEGVDEADVVKTDGTYLYVISGDTLRIVRASPPEELAVLSEVSLEGYGREIYLHDGNVVAITETYGGPVFIGVGIVSTEPAPGDDAIAVAEADTEYRYERPKTIVTVIDASTPSSPQIISTTAFDGSGASSRMIDGMLHLVLANYQDYYYDVLPMLGSAEMSVDAVDAQGLLPGFERADDAGAVSSGAVVTWREMYRPTDPDGFGVVTVVSMDVDNSSEFKAVGVVAEPGLIYSSLDALYLTDTNYDFFGDARETTDIYKLAYGDDGPTPVAVGTVPGRILNQYSMGEYEGYLRVATTVGPTFSMFGQRSESKNNVYVLDEVEGKLQIVGSVENIAPGEEIKAARFVGSRGFVVTFEQIDPLFTLDLSNPTAPYIAGELKVPGYSTFVVPMDADHLLTVGEYIPEDLWSSAWGVQLSIFDISDFSNPVLQYNEIIGETEGASSEAFYNPKAFTYFAEAGLVALPVSIYGGPFFFEDIAFGSGDDEGETTITDVDVEDEPSPDGPVILPEPFMPQGFDGLVVYRVSVEEGFTGLGRLSTRFEQAGYYWSSFTRGVFIGDDVFAVTDHGVRAAPVSDIESAPYELVFESSDDGSDGVEPGGVGGSPSEETPSDTSVAPTPTGG